MKASPLFAAILCVTIPHAAQPVQWVDLPANIGLGKMRSDGRQDREYRIVTNDNIAHIGYELIFSSDDVKLSEYGPAYPRSQVTEIRIRHDGRCKDAISIPSLFNGKGSGGSCGVEICVSDLVLPFLLLPMLPLELAARLAVIPILLPIHFVKQWGREKVIKVTP